ncbi:MAG: ATP-dependent Clp protease ATP-binding subunit, partial [Planctomycetales bacterium]|nr:ATP-dependent Clp protease ATP-binding subunit [Planctomycetales bacterium]
AYDSMKSRVNDQIQKVFRPEFLNRLDDVIIFRHLTKENLKEVIDLELAKVRERLEERGLNLELTDAAKEFLIKKGTDLDYGARPLRRAIENRIEDPLSEELLRGTFQGMDTIVVDGIRNDEDKVIRLDFRPEKRQPDPPKEEPVAAGATDSETPKEKSS